VSVDADCGLWDGDGGEPAQGSDGELLKKQMASRTSLSRIGGRDVFEKCFKFMTADNARAMGVYPFFRPLDQNNGPEAMLDGHAVTMLGSNNYLGLTTPRCARRPGGDRRRHERLAPRERDVRLHKTRSSPVHGKEAGLVFTAGYQVNLATISACSQQEASP
jgi:hypothetical protein